MLLVAAAILATSCGASTTQSPPGLAPSVLSGVGNFRPVSPLLPGVFRSAGLERAGAADVAHLLDGARIRTIIDLRNDDEIEKARGASTSYGRALCDLFDRGAVVGAGQAASEGAGTLARVQIPLLGDTEAFFDEVAARLPAARKAEANLYRTFDAKRYDRLLYDEVARNRQLGLYTVMCRTATADIGRALALVAERREVGAVLFHCAQGKDRTGVLAALLQHTVGEDEAALVESYAASADMLREHAARVGDAGRGGGGADAGRKKKGDDGVDWSSLEGSPPEAMVGTLAWLRREHGSIDGFLVEAVPGDAEVWRRRLLDAVRRPC